jgi:hypothetical protein
MKKLLVKIKVIDIPYSPAVEAIPATETEPEIPAIPEQLEVSHEEIIAQTQGSDEELAQWLAGDSFKYPEGYWVEYVDISAQVEQDKINAEALAYLASTDWMIIRETETQVACPAEIKQLRAEARLKVVK